MIDTTSDHGVKNKLTLQRSDDLEYLTKKKDVRIPSIPCLKNGEFVIIPNPEVRKKGRRDRSLRRTIYVVNNRFWIIPHKRFFRILLSMQSILDNKNEKAIWFLVLYFLESNDIQRGSVRFTEEDLLLNHYTR